MQRERRQFRNGRKRPRMVIKGARNRQKWKGTQVIGKSLFPSFATVKIHSAYTSIDLAVTTGTIGGTDSPILNSLSPNGWLEKGPNYPCELKTIQDRYKEYKVVAGFFSFTDFLYSATDSLDITYVNTVEVDPHLNTVPSDPGITDVLTLNTELKNSALRVRYGSIRVASASAPRPAITRRLGYKLFTQKFYQDFSKGIEKYRPDLGWALLNAHPSNTNDPAAADQVRALMMYNFIGNPPPTGAQFTVTRIQKATYIVQVRDLIC